MRKRVGIARGMANNAEIMLYDEPTSGLDPLTTGTITRLIMKLQRELGVTSIVVSHDIRSVFRMASKVALLHDHRITFFGTPEEMTASEDSYIQDFLGGAVAMKRSSFITWDQLKVGGIILAALARARRRDLQARPGGEPVLEALRARRLSAERQRLAHRRDGVRRRPIRRDDQVDRVSAGGQRHDAEPAGPHGGRRRHCRSRSAATRSAKVRTLGLLGDKVIDISIGTPRLRRPARRATRSPSRRRSTTRRCSPRRPARSTDMVGLTHDMRTITGGIVGGKGTIGQLMTNRALYDQFIGTMGARQQHAGAIRESDMAASPCCSTTRAVQPVRRRS